MPNHVSNILTVRGSEEQRQAVLQAVRSDTDPEQLFDFDKLIPMPKSLDIEKGSRTQRGVSLLLAAMDPTCPWQLKDTAKLQPNAFAELCRSVFKASEMGVSYRPLSADEIEKICSQKGLQETIALGRAALQNLQEYGTMDWYDWRVQHWGTKWNSYDACLDDDGSLCFTTAWDPPEPIIRHLSELFPEVKLEHAWTDENIGYNVGKAGYLAGQVVEQQLPEWGSAEAIRMSLVISGIEPEDIGLRYVSATGEYVSMDETSMDKTEVQQDGPVY